MDKQPNSRMCFVCDIENPIGLALRFYTDDGAAASPASLCLSGTGQAGPSPSTRAIPDTCTAA
jgi:hypothetical protein